MVILPGALASAFTMAFVGRNCGAARRARHGADRRAAASCSSMYKLSLLTYDAGAHDLFWPLISAASGSG